MTLPTNLLFKGSASASGTKRYAARFATAFATFRGLRLSRVGLGTSLGSECASGRRYGRAVETALSRGINVIDTAISYGAQTSERAIGIALRRAFQDGLTRDEVFLVSKCGYLPRFPERCAGAPPTHLGREPVRLDVKPHEIISSSHCIAPAFIRDQLARSRDNLGLRTIDAYLLHNPEIQAARLSAREFERRLAAAFETLERACTDRFMNFFGISSWSAFRCKASAPEHLNLLRLCEIAADVGGPGNRFAVIEAPYSVLHPELATRRTQRAEGQRKTPLEIARANDLLVLASAPLAGGQLALPGVLSAGRDSTRTGGQQAIHFSCSEPGVTSALVGMRSKAHVNEAVQALKLLSTEDAARPTEPRKGVM